MVRRYAAPLIGAFLSLTQVAAAYQAGSSPIAWWWWLVAVSVILVVAFIIILALDFKDSAGRHDEDDD